MTTTYNVKTAYNAAYGGKTIDDIYMPVFDVDVDVDVPDLLDVPVPGAMSPAPIDLPTVSLDVSYPTADDINAPLNVFAFTRYASMIQSVLDGKMTDLLEWDYSDDSLEMKFGLLKERIMNEADIKMKEVLTAMAARNFPQLSGPGRKMVYDIDIAARKMLSAEAYKMFAEQLQVSRQQIEFVFDAAIKSEGAIIEHHNRVQLANLEQAAIIADNVYNAYKLGVAIYNTRVQEILAKIENAQIDRDARLDKYRAFLVQLSAASEAEQKYLREVEIHTNITKTIELENRLKLSEIEIYITRADIIKYNIMIYHAQLQNYIAQVETVKAKYQTKAANAHVIAANVRNKKAEARGVMQKIDAWRHSVSIAKDMLRIKTESKQNTIKEITIEANKLSSKMDSLRGTFANAESAYTTALEAFYNTINSEIDSYVLQSNTEKETAVMANKRAAMSQDYNDTLEADALRADYAADSVIDKANAQANHIEWDANLKYQSAIEVHLLQEIIDQETDF